MTNLVGKISNSFRTSIGDLFDSFVKVICFEWVDYFINEYIHLVYVG